MSFRFPFLAALLSLAVAIPFARAQDEPKPLDPAKREKGPDFPEKLDWINTAGPLKMEDLKGKIVILDFWTLCCINCIHILPDLAKLEKKWANELVVVGVHSAKFESEKVTKNIRKAVLRYEIAHPVVNDGEHGIWNKYGVNSWPTFIVLDSEGRIVGETTGEGNYEILDKVVGKLVEEGKKNKTLNEKPLRFDLAKFREKGDTPLFFPGKIIADEKSKRLMIADSTHHRVIVSDLDGKLQAVIGSGVAGRTDGKFAEAQFDDPQGLALDGDTLYIADRKNHQIRAADLKTGVVSTIAGNGEQDPRSRLVDPDKPAKSLDIGLNSPWDLLKIGDTLYIAMAGHHQIWSMDLKAKTLAPYAGDGRENIRDGALYNANFAQPSGLTTDGTFIYVADSEISAIRKVPLDPKGEVSTLIGEGLFEFGDKDGVYPEARIQHALAVLEHEGRIIVADTYNSKLKILDPKTKEIKTLLGGNEPNSKEPLFNEPAGLAKAGGKLYVADTNSHRIRVVDLKTNAVSTLEIKGLQPPPARKEEKK